MNKILKVLLGLAGLTALSAFVVKRRNPEFGDPFDPEFGVVACMGGRQFMSVADGLASANALAYMGGIELDVSEAVPADGATMQLTSVMGGIDVIVPRRWRVEVASNATMGEVVNLTNPDSHPDGPLVIVDARVVMGAIVLREVKDPDGG